MGLSKLTLFPLSLLLLAMVVPLLVQVEAEAAGQNVTVNALSLSGTTLHMWTTVRAGSTTAQTGFTPLVIASSPATYTVTMADYGLYIFDHWENGSTSRARTIAAGDTTVTAYYRTSSTYSLTIKSINMTGKEFPGMYTAIGAGSTAIRSGFTPLAYSGASGTYTATVSDYGPYIFDHWENGSTSRTRTVTLNADTTMIAYFRAESTQVGMTSRELAVRVHGLINEQRVAYGLSPLVLDSKLSLVAENHSKDMASKNYFSHVNQGGEGPTARAEKAGYYCRTDFGGGYYSVGVAENILQTWVFGKPIVVNGIATYDRVEMEHLAKSVVDGWMNSPGHKHNILTKEYSKEGVGVGISSQGKLYVTEDLC